MSYMALYRKFRPDTLANVKGQDHIVTTLKNQLAAKRIGHAYLFTGTRGTGKTTVAKILARAVNCENPTAEGPCGECRICRAIAAGASMNVIEIDAASNNGVDNIREIVEEVSYSPAEGKYKVYIIDEVHMLSAGAFNALLKTLEEPPSYVIFILATTEVHKLPITILSRCQRYDFKRITIDTITARMQELTKEEGVQVEEKALRYIAKTADGSMRDALSLLDQCIAFHLGHELTYDKVLDVLGAVDTEVFSRLLRFCLNRDVLGCVELLEEIVMQGRELTQFVTDFTWYLRNLMLVQASDNLEDVIDMSTDNLKRLKEESTMADMDRIIRFIRIFSELSGQIRQSAQKRILVEIALIKLCRPQMEVETDAMLDRIRQVEDKLEKGVVVAAASDGVPQGGGTAGGSAQPKAKPRLAKAIPEDVRQIVAKWPAIVGSAENPMRIYLKSARLSLGGDNRLCVVFADGMASDYFNKSEHKALLEALLSDFSGKEIEVNIQTVGGVQEFEDNYVDISQVIQMEIEEEEDQE
ncbi:DNA polymerase III subunit gamma/tau [Acetatifactor aquisgranensis]|uniref:DNA polymerase III subunit gamma/tau n=1 Tax=Acetatifactor aquisgranensis TaxID=2941233 RepID=UPI00203D0C5E|nr:DNA polymerase III subunit gamma/tau [Acetatifactor aquisgranensis]